MPEEEGDTRENDKTKIKEVIEKPEFTMSENGKRYAKCGVCNKSVSHGGWTRHARAHRGERRHSCHACGLAFNDSGNLQRHARAIHQRQRPFACPSCPKTFSRKSHLEDHTKSHSDSRTFVCDICGKGSKSGAALRMHARTHDACRFPCVQCGARFKRRGELSAHVSVHTGEKAHVCHCGKSFRLRSQLTAHTRVHQKSRIEEMEDLSNADTIRFTSMPMYGPAQPQHYRACTYCVSSHPVHSYKEHLVTAHSDLLFHCEECKAYIDKKDFFIHMSLHALQHTTLEAKKKKIKKKEEVICKQEVHNPSPVPPENRPLPTKTNDIRPAVVKTKRSVEENEFSDHSDMEGFGPLPESVFEAIEDSQDSQHIEYEQNTSHATPETERCSDESNKCPEPKSNHLNNPAVNINKLNNCSVVIESIDLNNCAQINIAVKNDKINNNLALPANSTASNSTDVSDNDATHEGAKKSHKKTRNCPFCPKQYTASSSYYYHLKYFHKGSKEHACEVCAKKFGTRSCLTQHMAVHTGHHDFKCHQCKKQFKSKASLYIHEQTHNGKKSWSCSQCHTSFRWKTHLFRHMKRHTAEKSHVCTMCGRGFNVRCDLLRHARTHTVESVTCDKCGQKFAQPRYLKVHTRRQHLNGIKKVSK